MSMSMYSCFNNNPIWITDIHGDTTQVNGNDENTNMFLKDLNKRTGNTYAVDADCNLYNAGGSANIKTDSKKSVDLSGLVESSITSEKKITLDLVNNDPNTLVDSYQTGKVDVGDLHNMDAPFQAGQFAHIFSERLNWEGGYNDESKRTAEIFLDAHNNFGLVDESKEWRAC